VQSRWFEGPGEEQLYDVVADPLELDNLATDPARDAELNRLRDELARWRERIGDWSDESEEAMVARFQPGGDAPVTATPLIALKDGQLHITAADDASIGYRIDEGPWLLYTVPLTVEANASIEARAIRYGWDESDTAVYTVN